MSGRELEAKHKLTNLPPNLPVLVSGFDLNTRQSHPQFDVLTSRPTFTSLTEHLAIHEVFECVIS